MNNKTNSKSAGNKAIAKRGSIRADVIDVPPATGAESPQGTAKVGAPQSTAKAVATQPQGTSHWAADEEEESVSSLNSSRSGDAEWQEDNNASFPHCEEENVRRSNNTTIAVIHDSDSKIETLTSTDPSKIIAWFGILKNRTRVVEADTRNRFIDDAVRASITSKMMMAWSNPQKRIEIIKEGLDDDFMWYHMDDTTLYRLLKDVIFSVTATSSQSLSAKAVSVRDNKLQPYHLTPSVTKGTLSFPAADVWFYNLCCIVEFDDLKQGRIDYTKKDSRDICKGIFYSVGRRSNNAKKGVDKIFYEALDEEKAKAGIPSTGANGHEDEDEEGTSNSSCSSSSAASMEPLSPSEKLLQAIKVVQRALMTANDAVNIAHLAGMFDEGHPSIKPRIPESQRLRGGSTSSVSRGPPSNNAVECKVCGRTHPGVCDFLTYPHDQCNRDPSLAWSASNAGLKYREKGYDKCMKEHWRTIPHTKFPNKRDMRGNDHKRSERNQGITFNREEVHLLQENNFSHVVTVFIYANGRYKEAKALIDSGAIHGSYVSAHLSAWLAKEGVTHQCHTKIISALTVNKEALSMKQYNLKISFINEITDKQEMMNVEVKVLKMDYDIIIGRPTIKQYDLTRRMPSQFQKESEAKIPSSMSGSLPENRNQNDELAAAFRQEEDGMWRNRPDGALTRDEERSSHELALDDLFNDIANGGDGIELIKFFGTEEEQQRIRRVVNKYMNVFRTSLTSTPANIPPMKLDVNEEQWQANRANKQPPRNQSTQKQEETHAQIQKYLDIGVMVTSQQGSHSQVLMTPKPDGSYRFCVDFTQLNKCTLDTFNWPIPNIWDMLQRLGQRRSKYFGIVDLTAGFYQAPLHPSSRKFTAFTAFCGLYEWTRVPMGLKGAPSYFQAIIASVVLAGLMYHICEAYIDDIIITGNNIEEFCYNLEQVLKRFQEYNITISPKKVKLGMQSCEFVGHTINEQGMTFSRPKLDSIMNFPLPTTVTTLQSFLGLANYFRKHVKNHSELAKPLFDLIKKTTKHSPLVWQEESLHAYESLKLAVHSCPQLWFRKAGSPLHLYTDASDFGIGAYVCQQIDNEEQPLAFMSKLFHDEQKRWDTFDKEAFAIFKAFKDFEYILRDEFFTVHTDHANLRYLHEGSSAKVRRWWLTMQEYKFDLVHIAGKDNVVADRFSRLCALKEEDLDSNDLAWNDNPEERALTQSKPRLDADSKYLTPQTYKAISHAHNSKVGHFGVATTIKHMSDPTRIATYTKPWQGMQADVASFIRRCPCCQKMSVLKTPIITNKFTTSSYMPMERLNIDTMGPFKADTNGNTQIIVIIDTFSRWVELYPRKDTTAAAAADALMEHYGTFGAAAEIVSDNGSQYANHVLEELGLLVGNRHTFTTAYSKEENAIVERANKEVLRHMRAMIFEENTVQHWHRYLPLIKRIMNSKVHSRTGVSPEQIIFGGAINLNRNMFASEASITQEIKESRKSLSQWASDMLSAQSRFIRIAQKVQEKNDIRHLESNPPDSMRIKFPINSFVLATYPSSNMKPGPPQKHLTYKKGPLRVQGYNSKEDFYNLINLCNHKVETIHSSRLTAFEYDPEHTDPTQVAYRDQELFNIEKVITFSGKKLEKKKWTFLVKWEGYEDLYNTWQSWDDVKGNSVVHDYLRRINMAHAIPKSFQNEEDTTPLELQSGEKRKAESTPIPTIRQRKDKVPKIIDEALEAEKKRKFLKRFPITAAGQRPRRGI